MIMQATQGEKCFFWSGPCRSTCEAARHVVVRLLVDQLLDILLRRRALDFHPAGLDNSAITLLSYGFTIDQASSHCGQYWLQDLSSCYGTGVRVLHLDSKPASWWCTAASVQLLYFRSRSIYNSLNMHRDDKVRDADLRKPREVSV
jgi:hypothetical protein